MATYKRLTPQQIRTHAQATISQRNAARQFQKPSAYSATAIKNAQQKAAQKTKNDANVILRLAATQADLSANVLTGALKGLEGIYDFGAGIVGAVGGIFSEDFRDDVQEHIEYDAVGTHIGNPLDEMLSDSYLEDMGKVGEIIEGVASSVGQMLPAVAVTVATGGAGAASLATLGVSAAGNATEEAYKDGAGYYQGLGYGALSGGVEVATEAALGGLTKGIYGQGWLNKVLPSAAGRSAVKAGAKVGGQRIIKGMLEEAAEEAAAELASPALKAIYKGKDAFKEYGEGDYWAGVGEAALIGGLTSAAYGGTLGRIKKLGGGSGLAKDAESVLEDIEAQRKAAYDLSAKDKLTQEQAVNIQKTIKADIELLEKQMKKAPEKTRAELLEQGLNTTFDEQGNIRPEAMEQLDKHIAAAADTTYDYRYRSIDLDADTITKTLDKTSATAFTGEMNETQRKNLGKITRLLNFMSQKSGGSLKFVIANEMQGEDAYYDTESGVIVIGADQLNNEKVVLHEGAHATEGTFSASILNTLLKSDPKTYANAISEFLTRGYSADFLGTNENADEAKKKLLDIIKRAENENIEPREPINGEVRYSKSNEKDDQETQSIKEQIKAHSKELADMSPVDNITYTTVNKKDLHNRISQAFKEIGFKIDRQGFGIIEIGEKQINKSLNYINTDAEKAAFFAIPKVLKRGIEVSEHTNHKERNYGTTTIAAKILINGTPGIVGAVVTKIDGKNKYRVHRILTPDGSKFTFNITKEDVKSTSGEPSLKSKRAPIDFTSSTSSIPQNEEKSTPSDEKSFDMSRNETSSDEAISEMQPLTEAERKVYEEFESESYAFAAQDILGSERVIRHMLRNDFGMVERILGKLQDIKESFENRNDEDAKRAAKLARDAEKLYLSALEEIGAKYVNGKIVQANDEDEENTDQETIKYSRMNDKPFEENVSDIISMSDVEALRNAKEANFIRILQSTPEIILKNVEDSSDLEVIIRFDALYLAARKSGVLDGHYHNLGENIKKLPKFISSPDAILRMNNGRLNLFATIPSEKGNNGIISIELNTVKDINSNYKKYNLVISAFTAKDSYTKNNIKKNGVRVEYQKEDLSQVNPQLYEWLAIVNDKSSIDSISQTEEMSTPSSEKYSDKIRNSQKNTGETVEVTEDEAKSFNVKALARNGSQLSVDISADELKKFNDELKDKTIEDKQDEANTSADAFKSELTSSNKVSMSKGQWAKFKANYHGEKRFHRKDVQKALSKIDALKLLPASVRDGLTEKLFTGYNMRLDAHGYEMFSNLMFDKIRTLLINGGYTEMSAGESSKLESQLLGALNEIVESGEDSIKTKLEYSVSQDALKKEADFWRGEYRRTLDQAKIRGRIYSRLQQLKNIKTGAYESAAKYKSKTFDFPIKELARIEWRGNIIYPDKVREHIKALNEWYNALENPIYSSIVDNSGNASMTGRFNNDVKQMLESVSKGSGALSTDELTYIEKIVSYFVGEMKDYNTVIRNGKRVEAVSLAQEYIDKAKLAREMQIKCGAVRAMTRNRFATMVLDPAALMRQADRYMNGFFTEMFDEMRQGEITSAVREMELAQEFRDFWEKNKSYRKHYNQAKIKVNDKEISLGYAMSLYMTYKRRHAQAGLVLSGFDILEDGKKITVYRGTDEKLTQNQISRIAKTRANELYAQFSENDKKLISIMERAFEECRKLKIDVDMALQYFTNVDNADYYFPIRRSQIAQNVDMFSMFEGDRVSNLSMNKDIVKGAKNALLIEPVHLVFMRHIKATSLYSGLGIFTDNFNRLYNLNVNVAQPEKNHNFFSRENSKNQFNPYGKELSKQLEEAFDTSESKERRYVYVGEFSQHFIDKMSPFINIKNIPIVMNYRDAYLAMESKEKGKYQGEGINYHNMGVNGLEKALLSFNDPTHILLSKKEGKIEFVLQGKDYKERLLFSILQLNTRTQNDGKFIEVHVVTSLYGNKGIQKRIVEAESQGRLIYKKKELTQGMAQVQYESDINANSSLNMVSQNYDSVNSNSKKINYNRPETIKSTLESDKFTKAMMEYFTEIKKDIEGISTKNQSTKFFNDAVRFIRSNYAKYQLGANPKVWLTQLSSFFAASNILDYDSIVKGLGIKNKKAEVDEYCKLAWLRNADDMAAKAQAVADKPKAVTDKADKFGNLLMTPIGMVDRLVVVNLFGACQAQIEKNEGLAIGSKANKVKAGELLQRVLLETQQNSLASERSAAMRTDNDLLKSFTMFSADAMKGLARLVDSFGEREVLRTLIKNEKDAKLKSEYETRLKEANKRCARSISAIALNSVVTALLALMIKWWYRRDDEENAITFVLDVFGNMLGGIPFIRDFYSFFTDGYEMNNFMMSTFNDVLAASLNSFTLLGNAASGKEVSEQEVASTIRKFFYAAGQLSGIPVRNAYNFVTGNINRFLPSKGYEIENMFYKQSYKADLAKAIENEDEDMIATITGLMLNENVGSIEDSASRKELDRLVSAGYDVIPLSVGDTITHNGETYTLDNKQKKAFSEIYNTANQSLAELVKLDQYKKASDDVKASAIKYIYSVYHSLALQDFLGEELETKTVLFAEAIDIEKLAIIIATARSITADTDKNGNAISGSKKKKIQAYINSLSLSAAKKYMIMGYLGYTNLHGEGQVKSYINTLRLTKQEKSKLLEYSGYSAA